MIQNHHADGTHVHLFVRPAAKVAGKTQLFTYCGELEFERWKGDKPVTVWWKLETPVASDQRKVLGIKAR